MKNPKASLPSIPPKFSKPAELHNTMKSPITPKTVLPVMFLEPQKNPKKLKSIPFSMPLKYFEPTEPQKPAFLVMFFESAKLQNYENPQKPKKTVFHLQNVIKPRKPAILLFTGSTFECTELHITMINVLACYINDLPWQNPQDTTLALSNIDLQSSLNTKN